jgi:hypothetical protein
VLVPIACQIPLKNSVLARKLVFDRRFVFKFIFPIMEDVATMTTTFCRSLARYNAALTAAAYVSGQAKFATGGEFTAPC